MTTSPLPMTANGEMYNPAQVEEYVAMLYRHVDWQPGQIISLLGIGEKGTTQEGKFRERQLIAPAFLGAIHGHLKRWAAHHVAGFIVPAVLTAEAHGGTGGGALDKVELLTAIILDIDSGDVTAKAKYATDRLGQPSMIVASGGKTDEGKFKAHLYWLLSEPTDEVERVAALRKTLAAKVGGDQSFGRATQVVRVPGSVHAKHGKATVCRILDRCANDYDLGELAEIIEDMAAMPGLQLSAPSSPALSMVGGMDFTPRQHTAVAALHRDINEGGEDLTRWGEFSKVAGFNISEIRAGRMTPEAAYTALNGWVLSHMVPPWPQARVDQEFRALWNRDLATHGAFPSPTIPWSNVAADTPLPIEYFGEIKARLTNAWLVRNLLTLAGLALIYGSPGAGKSFFAIDIALRIAAGWPVDGRAVQQQPVIYIGAEGQNGLRSRVAAWRQHHGIEDELPFALIPCAVNLLDPNADLSRLIDTINEAAARFGQAPGLIVIDTLAATFGGGDENTTAMIAYINNLAKLKDAFGATVLTVHHRPKDALNDTPRGHSSLMGAMDTIIRLDGTDTRMATITKQKDAEAGPVILFNLVNVTLGQDEDGEPVCAGVVNHLHISNEKLSKAVRAILGALGDAIGLAEGSAVLEETWRAKWEEGLPTTMEDEAKRKAWQRARKALVQIGKVQNIEGWWSFSPSAADDPNAMQQPIGMDFSPASRTGCSTVHAGGTMDRGSIPLSLSVP